MKKDTEATQPIIPLGFIEALFLMFLALKLCGIIEWSWWWVFAPV